MTRYKINGNDFRLLEYDYLHPDCRWKVVNIYGMTMTVGSRVECLLWIDGQKAMTERKDEES